MPLASPARLGAVQKACALGWRVLVGDEDGAAHLPNRVIQRSSRAACLAVTGIECLLLALLVRTLDLLHFEQSAAVLPAMLLEFCFKHVQLLLLVRLFVLAIVGGVCEDCKLAHSFLVSR